MQYFDILGIIGLLIISIGVLVRKRRDEEYYFITGSVFLFLYSFSLNNYIFMILQIVFMAASGYELYRLKKKKP